MCYDSSRLFHKPALGTDFLGYNSSRVGISQTLLLAGVPSQRIQCGPHAARRTGQHHLLPTHRAHIPPGTQEAGLEK